MRRPTSIDLQSAILYFAATGLYPDPPAFFIAVIPSSTESRGVVFTALHEPPALMAIANAAALTLSGISTSTTVS